MSCAERETKSAAARPGRAALLAELGLLSLHVERCGRCRAAQAETIDGVRQDGSDAPASRRAEFVQRDRLLPSRRAGLGWRPLQSS